MWLLNLHNGTWATACHISPISSSIIRGSGLNENKTLLLTGNSINDIKLYPGSSLTTQDSVINTKKYTLNSQNGLVKFVLRKIKLEYAGNETVVKVRAFNEEFSGGEKEETVLMKGTGKWCGIPGGLKGRYFDVNVAKACRIDSIEVEVAVY